MAGASTKNFDSPDEKRTPAKSMMSVVNLGEAKALRMEAEPGWTWSDCIKPVVGTDTCEARHLGVVVQGSMHIRHDDGTEIDIRAGDAYLILPGHVARVTSDESFVAYEFDSTTAETFAAS